MTECNTGYRLPPRLLRLGGFLYPASASRSSKLVPRYRIRRAQLGAQIYYINYSFFLFLIPPPFRLLRRARACQADTPINIFLFLPRVMLLFCANCANGCERVFPRPPLPSLSNFYQFVKTFFIQICLRIFGVKPTRRKTQNFLSLPNRYQKHLTNTHHTRTQTDTPTHSKMPSNRLSDPLWYDYLQTGVSCVTGAHRALQDTPP